MVVHICYAAEERIVFVDTRNIFLLESWSHPPVFCQAVAVRHLGPFNLCSFMITPTPPAPARIKAKMTRLSSTSFLSNELSSGPCTGATWVKTYMTIAL